MPWWATAYFVSYALFCGWCLHDEIKRRHKKWIAADIAFETGSFLVAMAYWVPEIGLYLGLMTLPLFIGGMVWNIVEAARGFQELYFEPSSPAYHDIKSCLTGILLGAFLCLPLFFWGFLYAVLGRTEDIS